MAKEIHFIGVGGIGMSGLAKILLQNGSYCVSGSDINTTSSYTLDALQKIGLKLYQGHKSENIAPGVSKVVVSTDIKDDNPELIEARKRGIEVCHRSDLLEEIMTGSKALLVSGTHGKTTTSSLLSHVMTSAMEEEGFSKTAYAVGGILKNYSTNASYCASDYFVAEADESDGTFLKYNPYAAIVTNIDSDHLAHYGSIENIEKAFSTFCCKVSDPKNFLFIFGDCPRARNCTEVATRYGLHEDNDLIVENIRAHESGIFFDLRLKNGQIYSSIFLPLYGRHNALNAAPVFMLALRLGVSEKVIRSAFMSFKGVMRRLDLQYRGDNGIIVFDDYAHHPTEVKATLQAVRASFPSRRVFAVFQPHRPSRMKYIVHEFHKAFQDADIVLLTELYMASEDASQQASINHRTREVVESSHPGKTCLYSTQEDLFSTLFTHVRPYDIVVFMGAGDISKRAKEFSYKIDTQPISKYRVSVVYGGMSSENKISRVSAQAIWNNLNEKAFDKSAFLIETDGSWHKTDGVTHEKMKSTLFSPLISDAVLKELVRSDVVFPALHGPYGEDGTIQGFFDILGLPYVGADHVGCGVSMDKSLAKIIAQAAGVPVVPFVTIRRNEWKDDPEACLEIVRKKDFEMPIFVKPAHLGSSVGIHKISDIDLLADVLHSVFELDDKVIIEKGLTHFREIEFTPMGNGNPLIPHPGEILSEGRVYDYQAKYGNDSFETAVQANLPLDVIDEGKAYAKKVYQELGLSGLTRVDFLLDQDGTWYFNEANPIPGFTEISLYPSVWQASGMTYSDLLSSLLLLGFQKYREKRVTATSASLAGLQLEKLCALQQV